MDNEKKGQFFSVAVQIIQLIAATCGPDELIAYLVLARGAGKNRSSGWGINAIAQRGGFSEGRAKKAITRLEEFGILEAKNSVVQPKDGASTEVESEHSVAAGGGSRLKHRWRLEKPELGSERIYLPNSLIDGFDASSVFPMARLYKDIQTDIGNGIDAGKARKDALKLLMTLYRYQNLEMFAGVDPVIWHRKWRTAKPIGRDEKHFIHGTNFILHEISQGEECLGELLLEDSLPYGLHEIEMHARFRLAMKNIRNAGLVYEVLAVFTGDPSSDDDAQVIYPLYVFDDSARKREDESSLHRTINQLAIREYKVAFGRETVFDDEGEMVLNDKGLFRYISMQGMKAVPMSVLRLRYRAHDRDTGAGMHELRRQVDEWTDALAQATQVT